ncbi:MAG: hypothetical protein E7597_05680 [Ruminococcaceae bacterium]|nr:hypothetical protein [Oscillospiraceae bacterium]
MKAICKKISAGLRWVFGYGIMICLFAGGLTFFGFVAALIIGGDTAAEICNFIHKVLFPYIIKATTILVLLGLAVMYLNGEVALVSDKNEKSKKMAKDKIGIGKLLISMLVPIAGVIMWPVKHKETPNAARCYGLVGIVAWVLDICLLFILRSVIL